jgi:hypothetical protein
MAQQSSPSPAELRFEVASIKRSPPILDRRFSLSWAFRSL